jgi:methylated-DNA-[protein]-cysteine S-methyltransferase
MNKKEKQHWLVTFPSSLGWFALCGQGDRVEGLTFGHSSSKSAKMALPPNLIRQARALRRRPPLVGRLQAYAKGARPDDFGDIEAEVGRLTDFEQRVLSACRKIPFGSTLTYAQLAAVAGSPKACRAVGNCMARNTIPIIIPCHRVVQSGGGLGSYSAPGGTGTKKRLLAIEKSLAQ